ncbi:cytochrome oxidase putative small subunit CydP [Undibacterium sp. WLHG33]|uniref:cytochrome oxidase putative small subunit CydP n=1 Tax=Undibacterium sp. WLHG33 TaxID=3412482 RepID=UPI003C309BCE
MAVFILRLLLNILILIVFIHILDMAQNLQSKVTMISSERRLLLHLAIAIAVKLVLLIGLWFVFVRDNRVVVDSEKIAQKLSGTAPSQGVPK